MSRSPVEPDEGDDGSASLVDCAVGLGPHDLSLDGP